MTNTTITLTAKQVALLLQVISHAWIEPSEQELADEVVEILEEAENNPDFTL